MQPEDCIRLDKYLHEVLKNEGSLFQEQVVKLLTARKKSS